MKLEILLDSLDAEVFSGDIFHCKENRKKFREMMERWESELKRFDKLEKEQ
jgi:FMN phosphatase YigB (HAD superfamily)